jgi:hypothetical protein
MNMSGRILRSNDEWENNDTLQVVKLSLLVRKI